MGKKWQLSHQKPAPSQLLQPRVGAVPASADQRHGPQWHDRWHVARGSDLTEMLFRSKDEMYLYPKIQGAKATVTAINQT